MAYDDVAEMASMPLMYVSMLYTHTLVWVYRHCGASLSTKCLHHFDIFVVVAGARTKGVFISRSRCLGFCFSFSRVLARALSLSKPLFFAYAHTRAHSVRCEGVGIHLRLRVQSATTRSRMW